MSGDLPATVGRYQILSLLGRGGSAAVYLGRDPIIDRLVAVKLRLDRFTDPEAMDRFMVEVRVSGQLHHPNIVTIFDVGEHDGRPFIAMEYVEGETLAELIQRHTPLTLDARLQLVEDAGGGLAYAHRRRLLHLDVKPENLIVNRSGVVKIVDFGISRMIGAEQTGGQKVFGTPRYLSPERIQGGPVDHRSDVFSLGCVLYELLASRPAFTGSITEVLSRIQSGTGPPIESIVPQLPAGAVRIVHTAMAVALEDRYADIESMRRDLSDVRNQLDRSMDVTWPPGDAAAAPIAAAITSATWGGWRDAPTEHTARLSPAAGYRTGTAPSGAVAAGEPRRGWTVGRWPLMNVAILGASTLALIWFATIREDWRTSPVPDGQPADISEIEPSSLPAGDAVASSVLDREIWRLVALGNQTGALELLRGLEDRAADEHRQLVTDLIETAKADTTRSRAEAGQRVSNPSSSPAYRSAAQAAARADALLAQGASVDALASYWIAAEDFRRVVPESPPPAVDSAAGRPRSAPSSKPPARGDTARPAPPAAAAPTAPMPAPAAEPIDSPRAEPPAATPPVATPSPPAPPLVPAERTIDPRAVIDQVLRRYEEAYRRRDVEGLGTLMPSLSAVQAEALSRTFANAVSYDLSLDVQSISVEGDRAVASCLVTHELVPRIGSRTKTTLRSDFHMRRVDSSWVIERVQRHQP